MVNYESARLSFNPLASSALRISYVISKLDARPLFQPKRMNYETAGEYSAALFVGSSATATAPTNAMPRRVMKPI